MAGPLLAGALLDGVVFAAALATLATLATAAFFGLAALLALLPTLLFPAFLTTFEAFLVAEAFLADELAFDTALLAINSN